MNKIFFFCVTIFLAAILISCESNEVPSYDNTLSEKQTQEFLFKVSRYIGDLPKRGVDHTNKFDAANDDHYMTEVKKYNLEYYHVENSGTVYFMVSRIAPSIKEKYVALAGKFTPSASDSLHGYEEVFRTWKMTREDMEPKAAMLFHKMVKGEDLSPYYTANSGNVDYIEFPDGETYYDKEDRVWKSTREDVLAPYRSSRNDGQSIDSVNTDSTSM